MVHPWFIVIPAVRLDIVDSGLFAQNLVSEFESCIFVLLVLTVPLTYASASP